MSVGGPHRKAVHVAAVEPGYVDRGNDVLSEDPSRSLVERDLFEVRCEVRGRSVEALVGKRFVNNIEELPLLHNAASSS